MNWDDLRVIEAVCAAGSYAGAGQRLRIDETTVARRLARLERTLGLRLFEAADGARRPTPDCDRIRAHIRTMAEAVAEIGKVAGGATGLSGRLRLASTSAVAEAVLAPRAAALLAEHPGLSLQFLTAAENVSFSRWEADLAVRLRKPERGDFAISKLAEIRFYFFEPADPAGPEPIVCSYPAELDPLPESRFLAGRGLQQRARCVTGNVRVIRSLIRSHRAAGILPEYLAAPLLADPALRATPLPQRRSAWLLLQTHLRQDPAARLVAEWVRECFQCVVSAIQKV